MNMLSGLMGLLMLWWAGSGGCYKVLPQKQWVTWVICATLLVVIPLIQSTIILILQFKKG